MGKRTFLHRSRAQNQTMIERMRDEFLGEMSDMPVNKIGLKYQTSLINQICYDSFVKSRDGITDSAYVGLNVPSLGQYPSGMFPTFSQIATTVTAQSNYALSESDIGRFVCYDNSDGFFGSQGAYQTAKILSIIGSGCTVNAVTVSGAVWGVTIVSGGKGYTSGNYIVLLGGNSDRYLAISAVDSNGTITELSLVGGSPGTGYTNAVYPTSSQYTTGAIIQINSVLGGGVVNSVAIFSGGTGYTTNQTLKLLSGNHNCILSITSVDSNGTITGISIYSGGTGYSSSYCLSVSAIATSCIVDLSQTVSPARLGIIKQPLNGFWYNSYNNAYIAHVGNSLYYCISGASSWTTLNRVGERPVPNCKSIIRDNDNLIALIPDTDTSGNALPLTVANGFDYTGIWIIDVKNEQYWCAASNTGDPDVDVDAPTRVDNDNAITTGYNRRYLYTKSRFVGDSDNYPIFANRNYSTDNDLQHESGATQLGPNISDTDYTTIGSSRANGLLFGSLTFYPDIFQFEAGKTYAFSLIEGDGTAQTIVFTLPSGTVTIDGIMSAIMPGMSATFPDITVQDYTTSGVPTGSIRFLTKENYIGYLLTPILEYVNGHGKFNGTSIDATLTANGAQKNGTLRFVPSKPGAIATPTNPYLNPAPTTGDTYLTPSGNYVFGLPLTLDGVVWNENNFLNLAMNCVIYANGLYIGVGDGGLVITSPDGISWTLCVSSGTTQNLNSVTQNGSNGLFVAVGDSGTIITTLTPSATWTHQTSVPDTSHNLSSVACCSSIPTYLACSSNGIVWTSGDSATWSAQTILQTTPNFKSIAYGNNAFVAVGDSGAIQYSSNTGSGYSPWTFATPITNANITGVCYGASVFIAVTSSGLTLNSIDGIVWFKTTTSFNFNAVSFGNNMFVAVGNTGGTAWSLDGLTWTAGTYGGTDDFKCVTFGHSNTFVAGALHNGSNSNSAYSTDGKTWRHTTPPYSTVDYYGISFVEGFFVMCGSGGHVVYSNDGITWSSGHYGDNETTNVLYGACQSPTIASHIYVGASGVIVNNENGGVQSSPTTNNLRSIINANGTYVAIGDNGAIVTSSDGGSWSLATCGTSSFSFNSAAYCLSSVFSGFILIGNNGLIATSTGVTPGFSWKFEQSTTASNLLFVNGFNGTFFASGGKGTILTSTDGINWTPINAGVSLNIRSVAYGIISYGTFQYVAVGDNGTILTSIDAITWTPQTAYVDVAQTIPLANNIYSVCFGIDQYVALGTSCEIRTSANFDVILVNFSLPDTPTITLDEIISAFAPIITSAYPDITVTAELSGSSETGAILIKSSIRQLGYLTNLDANGNALIIDAHGYALLNGDNVSGAALIAVTSPQSKYFSGNNPENANGPHTHYTIYATEDINSTDILTVGNDPNAFALLDDIPMMKAFWGAGGADPSGLQVISGNKAEFTATTGIFYASDIGRIMPIVFLSSTSYYLVWGKITSLSSGQTQSSNTVNVDLTIDGTQPYTYSIATGWLEAWACIESLYIIDCAVNNKTININHIWSTADTQCNGSPISTIVMSAMKDIFGNTQSPQIGEQCFFDFGDIRVVASIPSGSILTMDKSAGCTDYTTLAFRPMLWSYLDSCSDAQLSPKIGTFGIKTRFMRSIPWDGVNITLGEILPAFLVIGNGVNYYYSELPNNYRYLIGDYDPNHQTDKVFEPITALTSHTDALGIFTLKSAYIAQTNLSLSYVDENNGLNVAIIGAAKAIGESCGCEGMDELCKIDDGTYAVILYKTGDICLFDGSSFSSSFSLGKIRNKIFALFARTIDYDYQYGLLIRGNNVNAACYENNKMYYIALPENFAKGQGELQMLPLGEAGVHFVKNNQTTYLYNALIVSKIGDSTTPRSTPGETLRFNYNLDYDDYGDSRCACYPITSSHSTSDDVGTSQAFFIEQSESHIFLNPDKNNTDPSSVYGNSNYYFLKNSPPQVGNTTPTIISLTAQNDIGQTVTQSSQISNNDDINFDMKVRGHRIRYTMSFSQAGWQMTGFLNYYKSYDKRTPTNSSAIEQSMANIILSPVTGVGRSMGLVDLGSGNTLRGVNSNGALVSPSIVRNPGPDGNAYSALQSTGPDNGLFLSTALANGQFGSFYGGGQFAIGFWIYCNSLVQENSGIILKSLATPNNHIAFNGGNLIVYPGSVAQLSIPTGAWKFILLQYDGSTGNVQVSINLAPPVQLGTGQYTAFQNLLSSGFSFMPICNHQIFDFRLYNLYGAYPMLESSFQYYFNDVTTNSGNRTLTQQ